MALRKELTLPLAGTEITVPITMRCIEIVERVYEQNVDIVAAVILANPHTIRLTQVAEVVCQWITPSMLQELEMSRTDIRNAVYESTPEDLNIIVSCIQGAALYCRKLITDEELAELQAGNDVPAPGEGEDEKKTTGSTSE